MVTVTFTTKFNRLSIKLRFDNLTFMRIKNTTPVAEYGMFYMVALFNSDFDRVINHYSPVYFSKSQVLRLVKFLPDNDVYDRVSIKWN